jgi:hypothetical protein
MSEMTLNQEQLKEILKTAIVELIRDNHTSQIFAVSNHHRGTKQTT